MAFCVSANSTNRQQRADSVEKIVKIRYWSFDLERSD